MVFVKQLERNVKLKKNYVEEVSILSKEVDCLKKKKKKNEMK